MSFSSLVLMEDEGASDSDSLELDNGLSRLKKADAAAAAAAALAPALIDNGLRICNGYWGRVTLGNEVEAIGGGESSLLAWNIM